MKLHNDPRYKEAIPLLLVEPCATTHVAEIKRGLAERLDQKYTPIASGITKNGVTFTIHQRKDRASNFIATLAVTHEIIAEVALRAKENDDGSMEIRDSVSSATMEDEYRRQGIGTVMYKAIEEKLGRKLKPSNVQTPAAESFWRKRSLVAEASVTNATEI